MSGPLHTGARMSETMRLTERGSARSPAGEFQGGTCAASQLRGLHTRGTRKMTSLRILVTVALAVGLAYSSGAPVAQADSSPAAATAPRKRRPSATAAKRRPAARPATRKPPKQPAPETTESAGTAAPRASAEAGREVVEHESRIEFDERMVRGQTAAGAIFLFERSPSELKSIVEIPTSFRERTVEMLQPR